MYDFEVENHKTCLKQYFSFSKVTLSYLQMKDGSLNTRTIRPVATLNMHIVYIWMLTRSKLMTKMKTVQNILSK